MIISHKHRYVFIQLPHTASTSIAKELIENYDGEKILHKHSMYHSFRQIASQDEKDFFVFSCIRNPLEVAVTKFLKYKNKEGGGENYNNPKTWKKNGGWVTDYELKIFKYIQENDSSFPDFLQKFYSFTYDNWSCVAHKNFDYIIRYENLNSDFSNAIRRMGLEVKRDLPMYFKTPGKEDNLSTYYTPDIRAHAANIFGPFMKKWGYKFPDTWGNCSIQWNRELEYHILGIPRYMYWRYVKQQRGYRFSFLSQFSTKR